MKTYTAKIKTTLGEPLCWIKQTVQANRVPFFKGFLNDTIHMASKHLSNEQWMVYFTIYRDGSPIYSGGVFLHADNTYTCHLAEVGEGRIVYSREARL